METKDNLSLILQKLCNQRGAGIIKNKQHFTVLKFSRLILTILLFCSTQVYANTSFNTSNTDHLNVTLGSGDNGLNYIDFHVMVLEQDNVDDGMRYFVLYIVEDNGTETPILLMHNMDYKHDGIPLDAFTPLNSATNGYIPGYTYFPTGTQIAVNFKWYFPQRLISKNITLRIRYIWDIDLNGDEKDFSVYTMTKNTPTYAPPTQTLSFIPRLDKRFNFTWSGVANTNILTKFIVYSNAACTTKIDSVNVTTASGSYSINLVGVDVKKPYTYYIKQVFNPSLAVTGADAKRYESAAIAVTNPGYQYPANIISTYSPRKQTVALSWSAGNATGNGVSYYVKRGNTVVASGLSSLNFTDFTSATISNWSNYSYTVYAVPTGFSLTSGDSIPDLKSNFSVSTSPNIPSFKDFVLIAHPTKGTTQPYMEVKWDTTQWVTQNTVKLYHRPSSSTTYTQYTIPAASAGYIDNSVTDNSKHFYKLEVNVFGRTFSQIDSETVVKKVAFKSIKATKNTVGDRIQLAWEIDRLDLCSRFEIYRSYSKDSSGIDINSTPVLVQQLSAQATYNTWDDITAAPGIVYQYQIKGYKTGSDGITRITVSNTDIGFRMPVGTVTGRITYGGGTAVSGVSLYVNSSSLDANLLYKSIQFKGSSTQKGEVALTKAQHGCVKNGFTLQTWMVSSRPTLYSPVFEESKEYSIGVRNDSILAYIGTFDINKPALKCKLPSTVSENSYFHLSVSLGSNDSLKIYTNGKKTAKGKLAAHISTCTFVDEVLDDSTGLVVTARTKTYIANKTDNTQTKVGAYSGFIDDVRLWSTALTDTIISGNYNHYLGGNETGLIGYWPLDEGINSKAFDCAKTDQTFNEHHINFFGAATATYVPTQSQLSIKGVTDNDGNYLIRGIPFSGTGSTYSIQPILGTHVFEPTQLVRYISPSSLVHNSSDFTDKSSFPVKIRVRYSNTKYPVPGVMLYVDENPCSIENKLITTASKLTYDNSRTGDFKTIDVGECVIDVPIGEHYIRAELANHTFENNGRWPAVGKQVFNENSVSTIEFADTTLVTVVGRVVGGAIENSYPIGFKNSDSQKNHSSHANIGKAQIIMQPTVYKDYSLNYSSEDKIQPLSATDASKFGSVAKYKANSSLVEITTDATTGEYMVKLPPIQWDINSVRTSTSASYNNNMDIITDIQSFSTNKLIHATDTAQIIETNKVDSFTYNVKKSFVYQAPTVIEVRDATVGSIAFGESEWHVNSPGLPEEIRSLYNIKGTSPNSVKYLYGVTSDYPNGKPIFAQGKQYALNIYAYESYKHPEGLDTTTMKHFARVPLKGAIVNIKNEIGILMKKLVQDAGDTLETHVMKLDAKGRINYIFKAGFPNLGDVNSGLGLNISIKNGTINPVYWTEMGDFRGIVTGCEPIAGTNFVTNGPLVPLVVLRDPPGSNSYAYMETGTTLSYSFVDKSVFNGNFSASTNIKLGPKIETAVGFGFMALTEMESVNKLKIGLEGEYSTFSGTTGTKTLTTKERIQTSASPEFVGSNADVYIGTSTNLYYCQSRDLNIQKIGLAVDTVSTASISGDTEFRFSQNEIVTAQLPKWKQLLKQLLVTVPVANFNTAKTTYQTLADINKTNYYITTLSQSDVNFGMTAGSYSIIRPNKLIISDTIETIANTIKSWENVISTNENQKKNASNNTNYSKNNISFDAGTSIERSYTYTDNKGTTSGGTDKTQAVIGTTFGFKINEVGMEVDAETKLGGGSDNSTNSSTAKTTTFGYILSDPDADNRFAVNVYKNKLLDTSEKDVETLPDGYVDSSLGSYIFELVGGQSSCPYEAIDSTLFYKENNKTVKLANGTNPLDAPYINIKSNTKTEIPNGKDASFILELGNNSIIQSPRAYLLSVDETSNPSGAVVSVDGTPLTSGRLFYVTPGQTLSKTLTLHQTKLDVLDYQNIKLNFRSVCDTISKSQYLNVTYVPSCSDLEIAIDRQIINTENLSPLAVTLKSFNQEYKNFLGLQLEYKLEGETRWNSKVFAKDISTKATLARMNITTDMLIPNVGNNYISSFFYNLSFDGLNDGSYTVRAKTLCDNGTQTPINNLTSEFTVVKDLVRPMAMGVPSPANGILTPETEVAVTFNENIQTNKLIPDNFEVKGVLNGATLKHAEGLALDGTEKSQAFTESSISLQNSSFAIETWVRTATDCLNYGNLFTIGSGYDKIALNMKKDGIELKVNDALISSNSISAKADWQYVSLSYNANNQTVTVNLLSSSSTTTVISQKLLSPINPEGRLIVGTGFKGNIHQTAIWSDVRNISDLTDMNTAKTGTETNLIGYWPMDEANGVIATDKVRSRNMTVKSSWFIEPNGKATSYNGINQSTLINSSNIPFTSNNNFTVEFWFKGKSQTNATLFSSGKGDTDAKPIEKLSVGFNNNAELCLNTNGNSYVIPNVSVLDTTWHHFALSVLRGGNSNVYIDGLQKLQLSSTKVGGMASAKISLGSRTYVDSAMAVVTLTPQLANSRNYIPAKVVNDKSTYNDVQDQYFNGSIDEVRIWGSALTAENIRLDMHSRLTGFEAGLKAYYPFEETVTGYGTTYSLKDFSGNNAAVAVSTALAEDNTPGIKIPRAKEDVSFSYTASDNKIIFIIDAPLAKTENCTLEFAVNTVYDLNGNKLSDPIKWTAFVNNNRLNWETEKVTVIKEVLDAYTFKAVIVNNSGKYENYVIEGLPSWLSVNKTSGKLNPLEKAELTFTVDKSTNIGSYETRITLLGNNAIPETLPVSLKVTGIRPDWSVNPYDYESSMNVIGQIKIDGVYQEDPEDILAAFIGTRCVGVVNPQFDKTKNSYVLYMDIYGNSTDNGQALTFSLWDAGTGRIYPAVDVIGSPLSFIGTSIIGSISNPQLFNATDKIEQQLSLKMGWNWISTNVVNTQTPLIDQFKTGIESAGIQFKSTEGYIDYANGLWIGNDITMTQTSMYMLKTNQTKVLKFTGAMAKTADLPITIKHNWNYIGYVPQFVSPVKVALSGLNAKDGDQIKSQVGFASYSGGNWYGSLQYMIPGLGYMYNSNNTVTTSFNYPSQYISTSKVEKQNIDTEVSKWTVDVNKYQMSMTVTAIALVDGKELTNENMQVGVFVGDECRGTATLKYIEAYQQYMAFMMVWGNTVDVNSKITFRSYDPTNNQEMISVESLSFVPDNITGSPANPYKINYVISGTDNVGLNSLKVYPNPVIDILHFNSTTDLIEEIEITDNLGRVLMSDYKLNKNMLHVDNLIPGIYTLRIKSNGKIYNQLFIKK